VGVILDAITYLIFHAGFMATTGDVQIKSENLPILLSVLAGFSTRKVIEKLNGLNFSVMDFGDLASC